MSEKQESELNKLKSELRTKFINEVNNSNYELREYHKPRTPGISKLLKKSGLIWLRKISHGDHNPRLLTGLKYKK
jgi:hypothetical protein